ncbi:MAG: hypothetical protein RL277_2135 [Planctomycetota bacterium]|jgi:hypothetical protein
MMQTEHKSSEEVRAALEKALEAPPELGEQQSLLARAWERFLEWLSEQGLLPGGLGAISEGLGYVLWVLVAVLVGLLLWYGWRLYQQMARARELAAAQREAEERESLAARVSRLLAEAHAAETSGDHRLALRLYFWALVVGLSGQGRIEYRDAWTGREMLERTRLADELAEQLRPLVREVDLLSFGGGVVAAQDSARMAAACREWLHA